MKDNYKYVPKESNLKDIDSFISKLDESKGIDFIWKYLVFQFNYYSELELVNHYGKVSTRYIFCTKSYERWLSRNIDFDYVLYEPNKYVSRSYLSELIENTTINTVDDKLEILKKKKFHNTEFGLNYCLENTNLYSTSHLPCILCLKKTICKEISDNYLKHVKTKE